MTWYPMVLCFRRNDEGGDLKPNPLFDKQQTNTVKSPFFNFGQSKTGWQIKFCNNKVLVT